VIVGCQIKLEETRVLFLV